MPDLQEGPLTQPLPSKGTLHLFWIFRRTSPSRPRPLRGSLDQSQSSLTVPRPIQEQPCGSPDPCWTSRRVPRPILDFLDDLSTRLGPSEVPLYPSQIPERVPDLSQTSGGPPDPFLTFRRTYRHFLNHLEGPPTRPDLWEGPRTISDLREGPPTRLGPAGESPTSHRPL